MNSSNIKSPREFLKIALLPGDGVGPEVCAAVERGLKLLANRFDLRLLVETFLIGGCAIDKFDDPLPDCTLNACLSADAVFLGAIGGPKWDSLSPEKRPEQGLLRLRKALGVYANIRPVRIYPGLIDCSPLKAERLQGVDLVIVRELIGGIYFGEKVIQTDWASDLCRYSVAEIERVTEVACQLALSRRKKLVSVDKANVLATSRLWRQVTSRYVSQHYPQIELSHQLVDSCAMKLVQQPSQFDVVLTENLFGDILSDEASVIAGSMGLLPSSSVGQGRGLFEPIHGSAPDIAGLGLANPFAALLSAAMMLRWLGCEPPAEALERAIATAIEQQIVTPDLNPLSHYSTQQVSEAVFQLLV